MLWQCFDEPIHAVTIQSHSDALFNNFHMINQLHQLHMEFKSKIMFFSVLINSTTSQDN